MTYLTSIGCLQLTENHGAVRRRYATRVRVVSRLSGAVVQDLPLPAPLRVNAPWAPGGGGDLAPSSGVLNSLTTLAAGGGGGGGSGGVLDKGLGVGLVRDEATHALWVWSSDGCFQVKRSAQQCQASRFRAAASSCSVLADVFYLQNIDNPRVPARK